MADDRWRDNGRRADPRSRYRDIHYGMGGGYGQSRTSLNYNGPESVGSGEYHDRGLQYGPRRTLRP
jgi:hypothetical protein